METSKAEVSLLDLTIGVIVFIVILGIAFCRSKGDKNPPSNDEDRDSDVHIWDNF